MVVAPYSSCSSFWSFRRIGGGDLQLAGIAFLAIGADIGQHHLGVGAAGDLVDLPHPLVEALGPPCSDWARHWSPGCRSCRPARTCPWRCGWHSARPRRRNIRAGPDIPAPCHSPARHRPVAAALSGTMSDWRVAPRVMILSRDARRRWSGSPLPPWLPSASLPKPPRVAVAASAWAQKTQARQLRQSWFSSIPPDIFSVRASRRRSRWCRQSAICSGLLAGRRNGCSPPRPPRHTARP